MKVPAGRRVPACVALGSNLADPVAQVLRALEELSLLPQTRLVARSRLWRTRAVGPPQPDYVNAAVRLETALEPEELFERLLAIEAAHGRTRGQRWGPRTLDLDLLLFGDRSLDTPRLTVPHPRLAERAFVLLPLAEVAGDLDVPGHGRVASLAAASMAGGVAAIPALGTMEPLWNNALNPGLTMRGATISTLMQMKAAGEKIAALTAYDASFAKLAEEAGVDLLLVGDSLAMVVQGHESTLPATVGEMVYHTAAVARGAARALLVADMPFMSYGSPEHALESAGRLMKEGGAHMVKLEGGAPQVETVRHLTRHAVPVCAHLGLLPQSVYQLGGYRVQGRDAATARQIREDALALQAAGAQLLVLECVPAVLAAEVTAALAIPVIGIGAGPDTDGQVLVVYDVVGIAPGRPPSFVRNFLTGSGSVREALAAYVQAVKDRSFPAQEHCYA